MYHLRLIKSLSYTGVVEATSKNPDVFTEDKATADAAVATGYFKLMEDDGAAAPAPEQTAHLSKAQLEEMKFDDLKSLAADYRSATYHSGIVLYRKASAKTSGKRAPSPAQKRKKSVGASSKFSVKRFPLMGSARVGL